MISNGIFSIDIQTNCVAPYVLLYRIGNIDTSRFQVLKVRLRITGATEPTLGAEVLLRDAAAAAWSGEDLPFTVVSDGQWHEYAIDCSVSAAWALWTRDGKIGLQFPHESSQAITVEVDQMRVESSGGFHQLSLSPAGDGRFDLSYPSLAGRSYSLYFRESLSTGEWNQVSSDAGDGEEILNVHTNTTATSGFYKLTKE